MKIYVNARFLTQPLSGVQRYAIECSQQIKKLYPESIFLSPKNILNHEVADELQVQIVGTHTGHFWEQTDLPFYLLKKKNPPLINLANTAPVIYTNNYITIHDLAFYHHPEWNSRLFSIWYNIMMPRLAFKAKHIFTVSQTVKTEIQKYYHIPASGLSVTYNGVSQGMLSGNDPILPKEKIIISVGSFNKRKNHHNLINAFLKSKISNKYKLVIVGDKNKVFSESGFDKAQLANSNIEIRQGFTDGELMDMYNRAEAVVSLSLYEGFGIPLLEGLFYGCKVICSDIPVYREIYGGYANFCDPIDISSITKVLNNIEKIPPPVNIQVLLQKYSYERSAHTIIDEVLRRAVK